MQQRRDLPSFGLKNMDVNFMCLGIKIRRLKKRPALLMVMAMVLITPICSRAQATQTLSLTLNAAGLLYGFPSTLALSNPGTVFTHYTGSLTVQYKERTSAGGTGSITVQATTDFPCASAGPCIAVPPTAGDALTYTCSGATLGTSCAGTQTISTTVSRNVVTGVPASSCTGGGAPCSAATPNTVTLNFALTDDPKYKTGAYTATLTFTISAS